MTIKSQLVISTIAFKLYFHIIPDAWICHPKDGGSADRQREGETCVFPDVFRSRGSATNDNLDRLSRQRRAEEIQGESMDEWGMAQRER